MGALKYWDDGGKNLDIIYDLFNSWHNLLRQYDRELGKYCSYQIYNEEPQVGFLAYAALKLGWFPIENFSVTRINNGETGSGLCDLSIAKGKKEICIEAKVDWYDVNMSAKELEKTVDKYQSLLDVAQYDVRRIIEAEGIPKMAVLFVRMYRAEDAFDASVHWDTLCNIRPKIHATFCAMHTRNVDIRRESEFGQDCPGIAAFGRYLAK